MDRPDGVDAGDLRVALVTGALALAGLGVAGGLAATGVGLLPTQAWAWALGAVALLAQAVALRWRRTAPRAVLLVAASGMLLCGVAGLGDVFGLGQLAVLVGAYSLGLEQPPGRSWPTFVLAALIAGAGSATNGLRTDDPAAVAVGLGMFQGVFTVGLPLAVALVVAARREIRVARESRVAALDRERQALVQAAVARERTAMARELHDIAAHHLSGIAVMTAAIGTQIDSDPAGAKAAVAHVRQQSTAVLRDLRSLVGLLREDDAPATGPAPVRPESLAGIAALVDDVATAGRDVALTVLAGERPLGDGVGPLAQLAAYRMAQEALANTARHAVGARTEVVVDNRDPDAVLVTVRNHRPATEAPAQDRGGFGILGMRERAELTGADLQVGPTADGGWRVRLRMPREPVPDARADDPGTNPGTGPATNTRTGTGEGDG